MLFFLIQIVGDTLNALNMTDKSVAHPCHQFFKTTMFSIWTALQYAVRLRDEKKRGEGKWGKWGGGEGGEGLTTSKGKHHIGDGLSWEYSLPRAHSCILLWYYCFTLLLFVCYFSWNFKSFNLYIYIYIYIYIIHYIQYSYFYASFKNFTSELYWYNVSGQ